MRHDVYLLDGKEVPWTVLIEKAKDLDDDFRAEFCRTTSGAARVLRLRGHTVEELEQ